MLRRLMLKMADSPAFVKFLSRQGMRTGFAKRFIAGDSLEDAAQVARDLNAHGIRVTLDLLGEGVTDASEARKATQSYVELLDFIAHSQVDSGISIKPTQLGLGVSRELCAENLKVLLDHADRTQNFVRLDMEDSPYTEATVRLFEEHFDIYGPERVGIVIQSYLYRSEEDIRRLSLLGSNIRLCKGAYNEPSEVAYPEKSDVDDNFVKLLEMLLTSEAYTAIATHDDRMISHARRFISERKIDSSRYEFQMLYGIRRDYQIQLSREGYPVRVYVPFGTQWAPYFIRRLAERPANMLFVLKNMLRR